jgi:predicted secreted acid phosphatase
MEKNTQLFDNNDNLNNNNNGDRKKPIITKINTFDKITIEKNSLILCDIDDTVLRYDLSLDDFYLKIKKTLKDSNGWICNEDIKSLALEDFADYRDSNIPFHTEKEGFERFERKIMETDSKLYFITSRSEKFKKITEEQLESIGIDSTKYPIYFTYEHKISKADYIKKFIDITNYSKICFIDDLPMTVQLVKKKFPHFECFIYKYDK